MSIIDLDSHKISIYAEIPIFVNFLLFGKNIKKQTFWLKSVTSNHPKPIDFDMDV